MNSLQTYLGTRGYTLSKAELSAQQQKQIRDDLTIVPVQGRGFGPVQTTGFPAYRESPNKLYVPLYYGIKHFGFPKELLINEGTNINLTFNGSLRENQLPVVEAYVNSMQKFGGRFGGGLLELPCAAGKTVLALNIIAQLNKKTIIIVHKDFLANQWVERIQQFLPGARVGRIQGPVIDIHDKDIVIAMLQSLSMKEYSSTTFESFGLTVIDEVHHISSEVFSNSLFKLVTKYMLGLSATMNRKDGTTHVFKMFLGDVVFKGTRDAGDRNVEVRGVTFRVNDEEFNEVKTDFRGNVAYSTMISKLCEYNRRSEFILQVLQDLLNDTENCKQIMILGQYKNILKYLHDAIQHRNMASVGYYVGGMKEAALKETESKRVVIATYAMAAEALDIKTLTTLIMATPKTDIEQSVGRILREKHAKPIVVDVIDTHDCFQKQWFKRRAFYKRESYKIIACRGEYNNDFSKWTTIFDPTGKKTSYKSCQVTDEMDDESEVEEEEEAEEEDETTASATKKSQFTGKCLLPMFAKKK